MDTEETKERIVELSEQIHSLTLEKEKTTDEAKLNNIEVKIAYLTEKQKELFNQLNKE